MKKRKKIFKKRSFASIISEISVAYSGNSVKPFSLKKKGKIRTIISYDKDSLDGKLLEEFHERMLRKLEKFESSSHSYAYKRRVSTIDAVEPHKESNLFIKLDIHSFFESIKEDVFYNQIKDNPRIYKLKDLLHFCFYQEHLPLGFVTSPILSDIYMNKFDKKMEVFLKTHPTLRYSRYCDDILISTTENNFSDLHTFYYLIEKELAEFGLTINQKKVKEIDLERNGSISFLGLNISRKQGIPQITVSKTFILNTLDLVQDFYNIQDCESKEYKWLECKVKSRVSYIEYNSDVSYQKFLFKHKNKFQKEYPF